MASNDGVMQLRVPSFYGINQSANFQNLGYAVHAENVDTRDGKWVTAKGYTRATPDLPGTYYARTIIRIHRRFHTSQTYGDDVIVVVASSRIFFLIEGDGQDWHEISYPGGTYTQSNLWSFVIYEDYRVINGSLDNDPVDVILMSNNRDGMWEIWADDFDTIAAGNTPDANHPVMTRVDNRPKHSGNDYRKFSSLSRYKERIFGVGDPDYPDSVFFSRALDPNDWTTYDISDPNDSPAIAGGYFDYPTWDGDKFVAIFPYASYLVGFKTESICTILGADPGEFTVSEGHGTDGVIAPDTICVVGTVLYFCTAHGIGIYDGSSIRCITRDVIDDIVATMDFNYSNVFTAVEHNEVYYCAFRSKSGSGNYCDRVIEYDTKRGTFMLRTGCSVNGWLRGLGVTKLLMSDYRHSCLNEWGVGSKYGDTGRDVKAYWESQWTDVNARESMKSGFRIRCQAEGIWDGSEPKSFLRFTIMTERKSKTKYLRCADETLSKRKPIAKNIANRGRQLKYIMSNEDKNGNVYPLHIDTGISIEVELDAD